MAISPRVVIRSTSIRSTVLFYGMGFSASADRMALFPVRSNPGWQPMQCNSNGADNKIAGVCLSVCLYSVCHRSCGRNFESNLIKLYTVVWGQKLISSSLGGQNPIMLSPILPTIFTTSNAFSTGRSKHCSIKTYQFTTPCKSDCGG